MSDRERDRDQAPGFNGRAPWVVPMAEEAEDDGEADDQHGDDPVAEQGFDDVVWR